MSACLQSFPSSPAANRTAWVWFQCLISTSWIQPRSTAADGNNNQQLNPKHIPQDSSTLSTELRRAAQVTEAKMTPHEWFNVTDCTKDAAQHEDCGRSRAPQCERTAELMSLHLLLSYSSSAQRKPPPSDTLSLSHTQSITLRNIPELFYDDVVAFRF